MSRMTWILRLRRSGLFGSEYRNHHHSNIIFLSVLFPTVLTQKHIHTFLQL